MASVRGGRTVYRDQDDDDGTPRRSYTTIKRYQVPENVTRAVYQDDDEVVDKKIVIRRTRAASPQSSRASHDHHHHRKAQSSHDDTDWRITERVVEREVSREPPRRDIQYRVVEQDTDDRSEYRTVRKTKVVRAPSPPSSPSPERERVREYRFERERDYSPPRERDYDVERYSKSTEYFAQPQPIIIREPAPAAPIIIREERREPQKIIIRREEPQYEFVERKEVVETKEESQALVKKEETPPPAPEPAKPEEDYFYERRVVERRRRSDSYDREIKPRDSASQYSDESFEYVRRERYVDGSRSRSRSRSQSRKRSLATGALAGAGAAAILGQHRKKQGHEESHRGRNVLGGAALGAAATEVISRARSMRSLRGGSRSRSRSGDRGRDRDDHRRRRKHHSRSRSRSRSFNRTQKLGGLAAVAAVAALGAYALKNRNNKETVIVKEQPPRRSRSRRRRSSYDSAPSSVRPGSEHRSPDHRNRRIAQAGLASAAAAGIWDRVRSRSRPGGARSKSRVRTGAPIVGAGLGGAALAGLYEKNKANKEAKKEAIIEDEVGRGRRHASRSRSRRSRSHRSRSRRSASRGAPSEDDRRRDEPGLIAYGHDPIYPDHRRGGDYYSDEEPGRYRRRGGSRSSSPDNRNHSRSRNAAIGGAALGGAALAAHEMGKRRERSKVAKENRRERECRQSADDEDLLTQIPGRDDHQEDYYDDRRHDDRRHDDRDNNMGYNDYPQSNAPYGGQPSTYPTSHYFPPPPTGEDAARNDPYGAQPQTYPAYNPADYAGQPAQQHPPYDQGQYGGGEIPYGESADPNINQPYPGDAYAGDQRYGAEHEPSRREGRRGRSPENVSAPDSTNHPYPPPPTDVAGESPRETASTMTRGNVLEEDNGERRRSRGSRDGGTS